MAQRELAPVIAAVLLITGLALIALGWLWNSLVPSTAYWGPQQADEFVAAQADLHAKTHAQEGSRADHAQEFAAARERFDKIRHELESARTARSRTGSILAGIGVLLALAGIVLYFSAKKPE